MKKTGTKLNIDDLAKKKELRNSFFGLFVCLAIAVMLMTWQIHSYGNMEEKNNEMIHKLLDANNSLAEKVVELEEKERKFVDDIRDYILRINKTIPRLIATEIAKNIVIASDKHNLPIIPIIAVMERESHFNPTLRSKAGARGLMQVMPVWVKELKLNSRFDFHDIEIGIDSGAFVLKQYLGENNNNMEKALLQYVNYDKQYVKNVYNSMGKFVVWEGLSDNGHNAQIKEVILQLDEEQEKPKTRTHIVIEGDTLSLIAQKYTGNVMNWKKLQELNPKVDHLRMQIGSTIILSIETKTTNL